MKKNINFLLILIIIISVVTPALGQNPFLSKKNKKVNEVSQKVNSTNILPHPFFKKIIAIQKSLNKKISNLIREAKEKKSFFPLLTLFFISFIYGVLHAAGPGHGKAVTVSYLLSKGSNLKEGVTIGCYLAGLHGLSGIAAVLILHFVLLKTVSGSIDDVTRVTQIVSYGLISIIGAGSLIISLNSWYRRTGTKRLGEPYIQRREDNSSKIMGIVVGLVPCPGVVLIMLFSLSMNMIVLGIALSIVQTIGMMVTISLIGFVTVLFKNFLLEAICRSRDFSELMEHIIETTGALILTVVGVLLFIAVY